MKPKKKFVRVGWIPYCIDGSKKSFLGFWGGWMEKSRIYLAYKLKVRAVGYRFKIVPIYAEVQRGIK